MAILQSEAAVRDRIQERVARERSGVSVNSHRCRRMHHDACPRKLSFGRMFVSPP
jgi:hypothetical protein